MSMIRRGDRVTGKEENHRNIKSPGNSKNPGEMIDRKGTRITRINGKGKDYPLFTHSILLAPIVVLEKLLVLLGCHRSRGVGEL